MTFFIMTFGCKANQADSAGISALLKARGYENVQAGEKTDIIILNTCAVTAESVRKCRTQLRRAKKENPEAFVAICGCFSELSPEEVLELGADLVAGSKDRAGFVSALENAQKGLKQEAKQGNITEFEVLPTAAVDGRTRALLKIQDGCENFCTYCIVPYARGKVRSMKQEDTLLAVERLQEQGYKEVVITGIEISSWGKEFDGSLHHLLAEICKGAPDMRIRLGSLEPRTITENFCDSLKGFDNLCGHFHLSLQSGSDAILKQMGRKYTSERYMQSLTLLRKYFPNCAITTDIIVGFPGETEAQFRESVEFVTKAQFADIHVFPYSKRTGTKAANMPNQIEKTEKTKRGKEMRILAKKQRSAFLHTQLGKRVPVLFETEKEGVSIGYTPNYCQVEVVGNKLENEVKWVDLQAVNDEKLAGLLI